MTTDNIKAIIWDLDNTLYRFDGDFEKACNIAAGRAALHMGVPLSLEQAIEFATQSHLDNGFSVEVFIRDHDVNRHDIHHVFHSFIDETVIAKSLETIEAFEKSTQDHILLTHGSADWARRVLSHLGLKTFFPDTHILGREDFNFQSKWDGPYPFEKALTVLGRRAAPDILVVEDTPHNLQYPHQMGMQTALIHHGKPLETYPDYIHMTHDNVLDILK